MVRLIYQTKNMLRIMERAGRLCYNSKPSDTKEQVADFIKKLVKSGHESVIEHSNLIFYIDKDFSELETNYQTQELLQLTTCLTPKFDRPRIRLSELQEGYFLSGNVRSFKDLIRAFGNRNSIVREIIGEIEANLQPCLFADLFVGEDAIMKEDYFSYDISSYKDLGIPHGMTLGTDKEYTEIINLDLCDNPNSFMNSFSLEAAKLMEDFNVDEDFLREHLTISYILKTQRVITQQEVRHRMASYSQQSQRYINFGNDKFEYIKPETIPDNCTYNINLKGKDLALTYEDMMELCRLSYNAIIETGIKEEDARAILPNGITSKIMVTKTLNDLYHYLLLRGHKNAQLPIRMNALRLCEIVDTLINNDDYGFWFNCKIDEEKRELDWFPKPPKFIDDEE